MTTEEFSGSTEENTARVREAFESGIREMAEDSGNSAAFHRIFQRVSSEDPVVAGVAANSDVRLTLGFAILHGMHRSDMNNAPARIKKWNENSSLVALRGAFHAARLDPEIGVERKVLNNLFSICDAEFRCEV